MIMFMLILGVYDFDCFGWVRVCGVSYVWFGFGELFLLWECGYGWYIEDMLKFLVESAMSEVMAFEFIVIVLVVDIVIMFGDLADLFWISKFM